MAKQKQLVHPWHTHAPDPVLELLGSSAQGLSITEASKRLQQYGYNALAPQKSSWLKRLIEPFTSLFVIIMMVALAISLISHEGIDAAVIGSVLIINALIYYFQQFSVSRALLSLRAHEDGVVSVLRGGKTVEIHAREVVPGDVVYLFEGLKVPADGRLLETSNLHIDESILTGESLPVTKLTDVLPVATEIYDQKNMVFKGTLVHSGSGLYIVTATADATELGKISQLTKQSDRTKTNIELKIDDITKKIVIGVSIVGVVVFGLALLRGIGLSEAARFTLSLVVSVVPEGLPVTLTVVLLLSAQKMAKHKALVKKLSSIETMGALTLIATDKTGTLTQNKLEVVATYPSKTIIAAAGQASITTEKDMVLDPLDELLDRQFGHHLKPGKRIADFPFEQKQRLSGALWKTKQGELTAVKGAPEVFLEHMPTARRLEVERQLADYTSRGYRTIAFGHYDGHTESLSDIKMAKVVFDGLIALADPIRNSVPRAIAEARAAGINVVMLTGDHKQTAGEIARQAGLITDSSQVADSDILLKPPNPSLMKTMLSRIHVFGRVLPEHKFNFLKSVKGREITAMTGDGVNDIPALVEADAGLAMGSGTDAAKEASDIVLLDDNFATIIDAVRLGRAVIANIRKMLFYLISTSLGEVMTMIGALLIGMPLPITAVQILWVNLVTDAFTVLPIGISKPEHHQMKQPPHDPKAPLLSRVMMSRTIWTAALTAASTLIVFQLLLPQGYAYAQTGAFTALVVAQWSNALNATFDRHSWTYIFIRPNLLLVGGIIASITLQALVLFGPLASVFGVQRLSSQDLGVAIILPIVITLAGVDLHKLFFREKS